MRDVVRYAMLIGVNLEPLLTPEETALALRISPDTLAYWRRPKVESDLPWVEVGGQVRYRTSDVQAWLDRRTKNGVAT